MIPEGKHRARADSAFATQTSTGKEFVAINLNKEGQLLQYRGFLGSEKQQEYTAKALRTCGWKGDDAFTLPGTVEVEIVVEHREYNGKTYEDVKYINPLTPAASADRARAMAAKLRGLGGQQAPKSEPPARPEPPPPSDDDSLPF